MDVKIGDAVTSKNLALNEVNPLTVRFIGTQPEGPYFQGTWADGRPGVVFPEDLA